jgi:hypothetical protein
VTTLRELDEKKFWTMGGHCMNNGTGNDLGESAD